MSERNLRKTRVGTVVSDKMDKTVVVAIQDNVKSAVESMTGLEVSAVNVNVGGITFPPKG